MKKFDYDVVVGHSLICEKLRQAVRTDHVVSSYLFSGSRGIGKKTVASAFSAAMLCESPKDGAPCLSCPSCRLFAGGNHPDFIPLMQPEDKKSIGIDQIRTQVIQEAYVRPFHSGHKVFLIEGTELTVEAQNALLKILEEPPVYAVFILLTTVPDKLLKTIRSRCLHLQFLPLSSDLCTQYFSNFPCDSENRKALAASFSQGIIGKGLTMLQDDAYYQLYQETISHLSSLPHGSGALVDTQQFFAQNREHMESIIDFTLVFLRDCLRLSISQKITLICNDQKTAIQSFCAVCSPGGLVRMMEAVIAFRNKLQRNADFSVAGLELLTRMQEEIHD